MAIKNRNAPRIGLTTYPNDPQGLPYRAHGYHTPMPYVEAVLRAGGVPMLLPHVGADVVDAWLDGIDGLIVIGGGDLDPAAYGALAHDTVYNTSTLRDETEIALVKAAIERRMPSLMICRGLQVLNVALGGTLHVHLPDFYGEKVLHRGPPREPVEHDIRADAGSQLARILKPRFSSVSWHHQSVDRLGAGLKAVAWALDDDVIEAIELDGHDEVVAVQWHPEMSAAEDPLQQKLFDDLIERATKA